MKAILASFTLALAPIVAPMVQPEPAKASATRTVVVSLNRLAAESTEGKAATQRLQQLGQKMAADLNAKQKEASVNQDELQKLRAQAQTDFNNTQRQVQNEMRTRLDPIFAEIAAQHGADLVLNADAALAWQAPGKYDITGEVLAKLNEPRK